VKSWGVVCFFTLFLKDESARIFLRLSCPFCDSVRFDETKQKKDNENSKKQLGDGEEDLTK